MSLYETKTSAKQSVRCVGCVECVECEGVTVCTITGVAKRQLTCSGHHRWSSKRAPR